MTDRPQFSLDEFNAAIAAVSRAIDALPSSSLQRVHLEAARRKLRILRDARLEKFGKGTR